MNTDALLPTVWVHVTTLMNWSRPPVGIVRVEQEYCRWLLELTREAGHERIRFCAYDRPAGHFFEIARERVEDKLNPGRPPAAEIMGDGTGSKLVPRAALAGWKLYLKRSLLAGANYLPAAWVPGLKRRARRNLHELLVRRARIREWWSPRPPAPPTPPEQPAPVQPAGFAPGDRWVSLGLDWDYLDQRVLFRLKEELGLKTTLICYDVIPILYPHLVVLPPGGFGAYLADMAWCADAVLCISEHTQRDFRSVMQRLGGPVPPTHVIRLGSEIEKGAADEPPPGLATGPRERPFVLFVSTLERRKNHETLYRAWTRLRDRGMVPHRLVFVGMQGWGIADLLNDLRLDPRIQEDIYYLSHVSDTQLAWLYRHAAFTVFPSLYEGWGLPVVESLAWGKFCLASNAASLPEAGGKWSEYLDPWDLPAWVERLAHYMMHPEEVEARNERIAREFVAPTWRETAAAIHQVVLTARPNEQA